MRVESIIDRGLTEDLGSSAGQGSGVVVHHCFTENPDMHVYSRRKRKMRCSVESWNSVHGPSLKEAIIPSPCINSCLGTVDVTLLDYHHYRVRSTWPLRALSGYVDDPQTVRL